MSHLSLSTPSAVLALTGLRPAPASATPWSSLLGESAALGPAALQALDELAEWQRVPAGQLVFTRQQPAVGLMALVAGEVALGEQRPGGAFRNECHLKAPAWLSLSAGWLAEPQGLDALALRDLTVALLPLAPLRALLPRHPALAEAMIHAVAREARAQGRRTQALMHQDAPARLAAWLCHQPCTGPDDQLHLGLRKRDIASQLAITPETLSRLMRSFSQQGWIRVAGYTVQLLDRSALERLAAPPAVPAVAAPLTS